MKNPFSESNTPENETGASADSASKQTTTKETYELIQSQPGPNPASPIQVFVPRQKASKAPWIVLGLIVLALVGSLAGCVATVGQIVSAANNAAGSFGKDAGILTKKDSIAVMHMDAPISANSGTTPERVRTALQNAEKNPHIKAIVVRVNCPGGTVAASEEIAQYIKNCTKPVVFSVSDLCASGAYMAASQSSKIVAMPTSSVGSIGVILSTTDISELLQRLGIKMDSIKSAPSKDMGAYYRSLSEDEKTRLQKEVTDLNDMFIDIVAQGRKLDRSKIAELATGTTYLGKDALESGLVDSLGTYDDALKAAADLAGMDVSTLDTVSIDSPESAFEQLFKFSDQSPEKDAVKKGLLLNELLSILG